MNISLRKRHRIMVSHLALVIPLGFLAGVLGRKSIPAATSLPSVFKTPSFADGRALALNARWQGVEMEMHLVQPLSASDGQMLRIKPVHYLQYPKLLLYWTASQPSHMATLPADAIFLGHLANSGPSYFGLGRVPSASDGTLLLYSLPSQTIVSSASVSFLTPSASGGK